MIGLVQGWAGALSTEQWKVAPGNGSPSRVAEKEKVGRSSSIAAPSAGPSVIAVSIVGATTIVSEPGRRDAEQRQQDEERRRSGQPAGFGRARDETAAGILGIGRPDRSFNQ